MFEIRSATKDNSELILRYINELAIAEEFPFDISVCKEDLEENLFNSNSSSEAVICYYNNNPCGFAVYYYTFSTTTGKKGIHLDDLYIEPKYQGKGFGKRVMSYLAMLAINNNCARFEWWALKTNDSALKFYKKLGAECLSELSIFRLNSNGIELLAANK